MATTENIFELATRQKLRFSTPRHAQVTVEDLWDLTLNDLDSVAKGINRLIKASQEESFLSSNKSATSKQTELALEVVKHVITVREAEKEALVSSRAKAAKRQKLIDALASAEEKSLLEKTPEQLRKELEELDAE